MGVPSTTYDKRLLKFLGPLVITRPFSASFTRVRVYCEGLAPACRAGRSTLEMSDSRETIARRPCTPPLPLEAFNENISASTGSSKEIAGLKKTEESVFSPGESKAV